MRREYEEKQTGSVKAEPGPDRPHETNPDLEQMHTEVLLGIVLHKTGQVARDKLQAYDLNKGQSHILFTLHSHKSLSQRELADKVNMTPPSITSAIRKMERAGYIMRRPDEHDQRVMRLKLTEKGEACIQYVVQVGEQMDALLFKGMSTEEKLLLRRLLMQIYYNLESERKD